MHRTVNPRHGRQFDVQDMPHGQGMPYMETFHADDFDDVPLNQSIRFGQTRGDYEQMNNTMVQRRNEGMEYRT